MISINSCLGVVVSSERSSSGRRTSRRRRSTTPVAGGGMPHQQPQPITSIHFDSGEIDSMSPHDDDGVTWGLDTDRCTFETTFPVRDHRRRPTRARLPAQSDHHVDENRGPVFDADHHQQQQPAGQGLRRWRTLEDVHHASTDDLLMPDDEGRGDAEDLRVPPPAPPKRQRQASPELQRCHRRAKSAPDRSIVGFYVDSDWDSTDDESQEDDEETEYRRRRRDDGSGDRRSIGAELLELEVGSDDWLEMQREIYRVHNRAEQMSNPPSPRLTTLPPQTCSVPSRADHQQVPVLITAGTASRTVVTSGPRQPVPQQFYRTSVPATDSTAGKQPAAGHTKSDQDTNNPFDFSSWVQRLLFILLVVILLGGVAYKYALPSAPPKPKQSPSTEKPETPLDEGISLLGCITTYLTDVFD